MYNTVATKDLDTLSMGIRMAINWGGDVETVVCVT